MTQQELQNQIIQLYSHIPDYILLFSHNWELIWENRPCPIVKHVADYSLFFHFHKKAPTQSQHFFTSYQGALHLAQLDVHHCKEQTLYFIRIDRNPYQALQCQNLEFQKDTENHFASMRNQIFGISNAVSTLYNTLEENSDDIPTMPLKESLQQLNIIQGNCCKLMLPIVCAKEISRYYQNQEITGEVFFLDRDLSNILKECRKVLGGTLRIQLETAPYLRIFANRDRLLYFLLYLIVHLQKTQPQITHLLFQAKAPEVEAQLTIIAECRGKNEEAQRHSAFSPFYQTSLYTTEEQIIHLFCKTYHVKMLTTTTEDRCIFSLRFPTCNTNRPFSLNNSTISFQKGDPTNEMFSVYRLILSEISAYRFY